MVRRKTLGKKIYISSNSFPKSVLFALENPSSPPIRKKESSSFRPRGIFTPTLFSLVSKKKKKKKNESHENLFTKVQTDFNLCEMLVRDKQQ